jgi:general stress protein YciG
MANQNPQNNLSREARSKGGKNSPGNFKNDPQRASEAGRKGGQASRRGRSNNNTEE